MVPQRAKRLKVAGEIELEIGFKDQRMCLRQRKGLGRQFFQIEIFPVSPGKKKSRKIIVIHTIKKRKTSTNKRSLFEPVFFSQGLSESSI
jgi:hypothetical protein